MNESAQISCGEVGGPKPAAWPVDARHAEGLGTDARIRPLSLCQRRVSSGRVGRLVSMSAMSLVFVSAAHWMRHATRTEQHGLRLAPEMDRSAGSGRVGGLARGEEVFYYYVVGRQGVGCAFEFAVCVGEAAFVLA